MLPGPADLWAGGEPHALSIQVPAHSSRALVLDIQLVRAHPDVLTALGAPAPGTPVRFQVLVNERAVAVYDWPSADHAARAPSHLRLAIPAAAHGSGDSARITLRTSAAAIWSSGESDSPRLCPPSR